MNKEPKTETELDDLIHRYLEEQYRGPIGGAQWIKIVPLNPPEDGRTWYISHTGEPGGLSYALNEAERFLIEKYDLSA
ncbi:MAG: hypothetical protein QOH65_839 [Methylobacteriaceae bacterium]|nr:hypothetical protein [Methylobacteriaceae bacterium]